MPKFGKEALVTVSAGAAALATLLTPDFRSWWLAGPLWMVAGAGALRWWIVASADPDSLIGTAIDAELSIDAKATGGMGQLVISEAQRNQIFIQAPLDLTNTGAVGVSVEVWLRANPPGKNQIYLPAMATQSPLVPQFPFMVPGQFLGHVVNISGHTTVSGLVTFIVFETDLERTLGVTKVRDVGMWVPLFLELRDRVSGKQRLYDVFGGSQKATNEMQRLRPPSQ